MGATYGNLLRFWETVALVLRWRLKVGVRFQPLFVEPLYSSSIITSVTVLLQLVLVARVKASTGAGFTNFYPAECGQVGFQTLPDPPRDIFAGGVFESADVVEVVMIQLIINRFEGAFDVAEIHDPATGLRRVTAHTKAHQEGVPV